jgi:lysophospholipase L1-like esterase
MKKLLLVSLLVLGFAGIANAVMHSVGVNLGSNRQSLNTSDVAGVVAQDNWNNAGGSSGSLSNMKNDDGVVTTADVSWTVNGGGTWEVTANGTATSDAKLMYGYIDPASDSRTSSVSLSQIPYSKYSVYVYFGGDNTGARGSITNGTTTYKFTNGANNPGGDGFQTADYARTTDTGSTYPTANYAVFEGLTSSSVTASLIPVDSGGDSWNGIFAVQIVEVNSAMASNPGPANGSTSVSLTADLSWATGLGAVWHDVYFGTSQAAVTAASRLAGDINGSGSVGIEDITVLAQQWLGTPAEPYADLNDDDDVNLADFAVVSAYWLDSADAVYKGSQSGTTYEPGTLAESTTYYWRIDEVVAGVTTTGAVWSFTTGTLRASNPSPANGATSIYVNANLSWSAGVGATSRNVYFGTSSPGAFQGNRTTTSFDPGTMVLSTTYYWRIDEIASGVTTTGAVWSFTTDTEAVVNIMPLGDSITAGWYRYHLWVLLTNGGYGNVNFVGSLTSSDSMTYDQDHEGHWGWADNQIADNIYVWLQLNPPDIILLHIGTNALDTSPADVQNILNIIDQYENNYSTHITVLLARIINRNPYSSTTTTFNNNVVAMANARISGGDDIIIVNMETGAGINYSTDMWDDVHPNDVGYQKMAALWYSTLQGILP